MDNSVGQFNTLARILKNAVPDLQSNHDPMFSAAILTTYARLWNEREHFNNIDECGSLKSIYRTTLGAIAGGIHPENQEKVMQWALSNTAPFTAHTMPDRIAEQARHAEQMMDCLYDIGHAERMPTDNPPSPAQYFQLRSTQNTEPIPMPRGYNRHYISPSNYTTCHIGCTLATPSLFDDQLPPDFKCPGCVEFEQNEGGENQLAHMMPGGCLYEPEYN